MNNSSEKFFPMFVSLKNKKIVFVGGGKIAERRIKVLIEFGAEILVISPEVTDDIENLHELGEIEIKKKKYNEEDINDAFFVIAVTDNKEINKQVHKDCKIKNIIVNIASESELCDFFFPAIINTGEVTIGVSGNGKNHKEVKEDAENIRKFLKENRK